MEKDNDQYEQDAKDALLQISESQQQADTWASNLISLKFREKSFNEFAGSKPKCKPPPSRKRLDTDISSGYREYRTPRDLPGRLDYLKVSNLVCYDTLKVLDECRPVLSHRAPNSKPQKPSTTRSMSKRGSTYASNSLPVVGDVDLEMKMKLLERSLMARQHELTRPPDSKVYRKYSKYNMSGVKHEHWGDYVIHLPSVLNEAKTSCLR